MNISKVVSFFFLLSVLMTGHIAVAQSLFDRARDLLSTEDSVVSENSTMDIGNAFKQALRMGSEQVVDKLGAVDGFNSDPTIHIPLPDFLNQVRSALRIVGLSGTVDDLELQLNRAAEAATPVAKELFLNAITEMDFDDVMAIYNGPNDSATSYFRDSMSTTLGKQRRPVIDSSLSEVGALNTLDRIVDRYKPLEAIPDLKSNLADHVVNRGMDGIFHYIAQEEAAIRENPVRQTTELLKQVFGSR